MDIILEMKANGFGVYTKADGSDEWSMDYETKAYQTNSGNDKLCLWYGVAVSNVKVYKKNFGAAAGAAANCSDGDYVLSTFDASDANDLAKLTVDGGAVKTTEFGDGIYAHAEANQWLFVPQISPAIYETESIYIKYQLHAIDDNSLGKVLYQYTTSSGNRRASRTLNNSEIGSNRLLTSSDKGVEVIFELSASGHTNYVRTADADAVWTLLEENKGYSTNSSYQILQLQYGLGISKAVMYKKVDAATSAFNAASKNNDATAMATALSTYAANYGIDLTKLDKVEDDNAVYAKLFNLNFAKAEDIAEAFNEAVAEQMSAEFDADFVEGDKLIASFDASNAADIALLTSTDGEVLTETFAGETYAYTSKVSTVSALRVPQILPILSDNESVFVKLRLHAAFDNGTGKTVYVWTENSGNARAGFNMAEGVTNMANNCSTTAPGVDVILEMKAGGLDIYTKAVGSDEWSLDYVNKEYQVRTGDNALNVYYGLAISNAKVYKKHVAVEAPTIELTEDAVTVRNYTSGTLVLASYESADGRMVDCKLITSGITADTAITISDKLNTTGATVVKAFLWNDMTTTLAPICEENSVNISAN